MQCSYRPGRQLTGARPKKIQPTAVQSQHSHSSRNPCQRCATDSKPHIQFVRTRQPSSCSMCSWNASRPTGRAVLRPRSSGAASSSPTCNTGHCIGRRISNCKGLCSTGRAALRTRCFGSASCRRTYKQTATRRSGNQYWARGNAAPLDVQCCARDPSTPQAAGPPVVRRQPCIKHRAINSSSRCKRVQKMFWLHQQAPLLTSISALQEACRLVLVLLRTFFSMIVRQRQCTAAILPVRPTVSTGFFKYILRRSVLHFPLSKLIRSSSVSNTISSILLDLRDSIDVSSAAKRLRIARRLVVPPSDRLLACPIYLQELHLLLNIRDHIHVQPAANCRQMSRRPVVARARQPSAHKTHDHLLDEFAPASTDHRQSARASRSICPAKQPGTSPDFLHRTLNCSGHHGQAQTLGSGLNQLLSSSSACQMRTASPPGRVTGLCRVDTS